MNCRGKGYGFIDYVVDCLTGMFASEKLLYLFEVI